MDVSCYIIIIRVKAIQHPRVTNVKGFDLNPDFFNPFWQRRLLMDVYAQIEFVLGEPFVQELSLERINTTKPMR
jgi:hypothetical protein